MARGFSTMHPVAAESLRNVGLTDGDVTQSYGYAPASKGFHSPEGRIVGHPFSSCVDLSWDNASIELKSKLVTAGFVPFFRYTGSFRNNKHIHCVSIGLVDDHYNCTILAGPRTQIRDAAYFNKDGLVGHAPIRAPYRFTVDEQKHIQALYEPWVPDFATKVLSPEGNQIVCYAFLNNGKVRCELRPFMEYWGYTVSVINGVVVCTHDIHTTNLSKADVRLEGGQFNRANVRNLAEAIGLKVSFKWNSTNTAATVQLKY